MNLRNDHYRRKLSREWSTVHSARAMRVVGLSRPEVCLDLTIVGGRHSNAGHFAGWTACVPVPRTFVVVLYCDPFRRVWACTLRLRIAIQLPAVDPSIRAWMKNAASCDTIWLRADAYTMAQSRESKGLSAMVIQCSCLYLRFLVHTCRHTTRVGTYTNLHI